MANSQKKPSLPEEIDLDEGLKSKRKQLTITSLVLLALSFSGAKVQEANTFILKLKFENQNGIGILLVLTIFFLLIRYFNYARPYHDKLFRAWTNRMLKNPYFYSYHPHAEEEFGLIIDKAPDEIDFERIRHEGGSFASNYKCLLPFRRKLSYSWSPNEHDDYSISSVGVGWENYVTVIAFEIKYQFESYFTHRENLDILSPYLLGTLAIASYFFNESFQMLISLLAVK